MFVILRLTNSLHYFRLAVVHSGRRYGELFCERNFWDNNLVIGILL